MKEVVVSVIYCDDIRMEVGSKHSFMGVYNSEMLMPEMPSSVPKLCAAVTLNLPLHLQPQAITMVCRLDDIVIGETSIPDHDLAGMRDHIQTLVAEKSEKWLALSLMFLFTPLNIEKEGKITVTGTIDGSDYKGNSLQIRSPSPEEVLQYGIPMPSLPNNI